MKTMISYAQNFEDVILERIFKDKENGFYIDIGACHPLYDSVTQHFYQKGWSGINVEPQPALFGELTAVRKRDINLKCCAGQQAGQMTLAMTEDIGTSTLDPQLAEEYSRQQLVVESLSVEVVTLDQIWAEYVGEHPVDFLKIDVEGFERNVLLGADFERIAPTVIVIEATRPNSQILCHEQWEYLLLDHYNFFYFDGLNRFYQRKGFLPDLCVNIIPPNVFDCFKPYPQRLLEEANAALLQEREALSEQQQALEVQLVQKDRALAEAASAYKVLSAAVRDKEDSLRARAPLETLLAEANAALQHARETFDNQLQSLQRQYSEKDRALAEAGSAYRVLQTAFQEKKLELLRAQQLMVTMVPHESAPQALQEHANAALLQERSKLSKLLQDATAQLNSKDNSLTEAANAYRSLQLSLQGKEEELGQAVELLEYREHALQDATHAYQQLVSAYEDIQKEFCRKDVALAEAAQAHQHLKDAFDEKLRELTALHVKLDSPS